MDKRDIGLYRKFEITRTDGQSAPGEKHRGCRYFALDLDHDPCALPALRAYEEACREEYPALARDLRLQIKGMEVRFAPGTQEETDGE